MYQLIETIKIKYGTPQNIEFHNLRFNQARRDLFDASDFIDLNTMIQCPDDLKDKILKCRIIYSKEIESISFDIYKIRPVHTLKLINCDSIDYTYKSIDRTQLESLNKLRSTADDILIVKNGFITDTSYANIVFSANSQWITPSTPLLKGTKREYYLQKGIISEAEITPDDLSAFSEARIINAMIDIEESPVISIENIHY